MRAAVVGVGIAVFAIVLVSAAFATTALAPVPELTPQPSYTPIPVITPEPTPRRVPLAKLVARFRIPIEGATLPTDPDLYPEAPRDYRAGIHEGIDFPARTGTPVLAAADGVVVRVDTVFTDWTAAERERALEASVALRYTPTATLDRVRGRQVWLDHGDGIVTRYAHLATVADLALGSSIAEGTVIGTVGSSGYPEGGPHLHLEIRVLDSYLGDGLSAAAVMHAYARAFR